jgi:hypothetical protein
MLAEILPRMVHDPDRLVLAQVQHLAQGLGVALPTKSAEASGPV